MTESIVQLDVFFNPVLRFFCQKLDAAQASVPVFLLVWVFDFLVFRWFLFNPILKFFAGRGPS